MTSQSKHDLWKKYIADYHTSGLKAQEWCDQNNLPLTRLRYWTCKFNKEAASLNNFSPEFVPIQIPGALKNLNTSRASISIRLGSLSIDISDECSPGTLRNVLETLSSYA